MQIHHDGALHWVCSSIDAEGQVTLYDSLMTGRTSEELDVQLALLYGHGTGDLKVTFSPIQQQWGGADCGLFAAAVCLALVTGVDPATVRWRHIFCHSKSIFAIETMRCDLMAKYTLEINKSICSILLLILDLYFSYHLIQISTL